MVVQSLQQAVVPVRVKDVDEAVPAGRRQQPHTCDGSMGVRNGSKSGKQQGRGFYKPTHPRLWQKTGLGGSVVLSWTLPVDAGEYSRHSTSESWASILTS